MAPPVQPGTGAPAGAGVHILSSKVSRALELRTDTPQMQVALDALAHLPTGGGGGGGFKTSDGTGPSASSSNSRRIDAKSVRSVIERDALRQALLFQAELKRLIDSVSEARRGVSEVAELVAVVRDSVEADVCCAGGRGSASAGTTDGGDGVVDSGAVVEGGGPSASGGAEGGGDDGATAEGRAGGDGPSSSERAGHVRHNRHRHRRGNSGGASSSLKEEQALANLLRDAFLTRDASRRRYENLNSFLEKFEMSPAENRLLESYNFEDMVAPDMLQNNGDVGEGGGAKEGDGLRFLDTLDKVRTIRSELSKTLFDGGAVTTRQDQQQLGASSALRMMEALAQKQERAYERLYHFLQSHLNLNISTVTHVPTSSAMQRQSISDRMMLAQQGPNGPGSGLDDEEADERLAHPFVRRALSSLSCVPSYHGHCLELIAGSRRSEVTRRFLLALTSGYGPSAPIEMRAHDPVSYVGDMLAFVFRSLSVECELARGLFESSTASERADDDDGEEDGDAPVGGGATAGLSSSSSSASSSPSGMLAHSMSGVARPLKSRISQVVSSLARRSDAEEHEAPGGGAGGTHGNDGGGIGGDDHAMGWSGAEEDYEGIASSARNRISSLYSICGLLLFYHSAMNKTMERLRGGSDEEVMPGIETGAASSGSSLKTNPLLEATQECLGDASEAFAASLRVYGAMLTPYASAIPDESEASLAHSVIAMISEARITSPGFESHVLSCSPEAEASLSLEFLCNTIVSAAISSCVTLQDALTLKEAIAASRKSGLKVDCYAHWEGTITSKEKELVEELVARASTAMLHDCGLGSVAEALSRREEGMVDDQANLPLASYPGLGQADLEAAMKNFYSSLFSPPLPTFDVIKDPALKQSSRARAASNVAQSYQRIYEAIVGEGADYDDLSFLVHTPDQVFTLLSL